MGNAGRNDPCPCGSGRKYKRCCLAKDQAAEVEAAKARQEAAAQESARELPVFVDDEDNLEELSNRVVDLINDGKLDEAEVACRELKHEYPDVIDWIWRTAHLHEARGDVPKAVEYYRRCLDHIDENPENFDDGMRAMFQDDIDRLETDRPTVTDP
ncbi:MAG: SEC-C metal-binding domain-containing protein [Candidatus Krumholzibacteriia bacterium]